MSEAARYARREDMSPDGQLVVIRQPDGDAIVVIHPSERAIKSLWQSVEFCSVGSGGGKSPHTLRALHELAMAIDRDNRGVEFQHEIRFDQDYHLDKPSFP